MVRSLLRIGERGITRDFEGHFVGVEEAREDRRH
jgi:hypothetical protein